MSDATASTALAARSRDLHASARLERDRAIHRLLVAVLVTEWVFALALALWVSPIAWSGRTATMHTHVLVALLAGPLLNAVPTMLARWRPAWSGTRHAFAIAQCGWTAVLIHLTGGRIETHFHAFGSLAFLAFYRDWRVLVTATIAIASDHFLRGVIWPESVYGTPSPEWWRFLEHAGWIVFEDIVLVWSCILGAREGRVGAERQAALEEAHALIEERVAARTAELATSMHRYREIIESTRAIPWELDVERSELVYIAPQAPSIYGYSVEELRAGAFFRVVHPDDAARVEGEIAGHVANAPQADLHLSFRIVVKDGTTRHVSASLRRDARRASILRGITVDVSNEVAMAMELRQAQKLEAVGRLAAGVAHEINTPIQFVGDSVHFVRDAVGDLLEVVATSRGLAADVEAGRDARPSVAALAGALDRADVEYVAAELPKALERSLDGLDRVAKIVRSMKEFAHPDQQERVATDINRAIESTLTIARHEYKYVADVHTELGEILPVVCLPGEINQVVLNLIVNAAHAIGERVEGTDQRGRIEVRTSMVGDAVEIAIEDTGGGIPETIRERIFDPFFTTKPLGKGTGQGLAIARSIVADKHGGTLRFETATGRGTTFFIRLPTGLRPSILVASAA